MEPAFGMVILPQNLSTGNGKVPGCSCILSVASAGVEAGRELALQLHVSVRLAPVHGGGVQVRLQLVWFGGEHHEEREVLARVGGGVCAALLLDLKSRSGPSDP